VAVDTIVLRDSAGKILISNADVAGATAYASTATWTYGAGAASAHRTALGGGTVGQEVFQAATAGDALSGLGITAKRLASDSSGLTNTTFVQLTGLTIALKASTTYKIEFFFLYTADGGHFKTEIRCPTLSGAATQANAGYAVTPGGLLAAATSSSVIPVTTFASSTSGRSVQGIIFVNIGSTAGDLTVFVAQQTTNTNPTVVKSGSCVIATEIP
jgi:hypothetical protein